MCSKILFYIINYLYSDEKFLNFQQSKRRPVLLMRRFSMCSSHTKFSNYLILFDLFMQVFCGVLFLCCSGTLWMQVATLQLLNQGQGPYLRLDEFGQAIRVPILPLTRFDIAFVCEFNGKIDAFGRFTTTPIPIAHHFLQRLRNFIVASGL